MSVGCINPGAANKHKQISVFSPKYQMWTKKNNFTKFKQEKLNTEMSTIKD
jgi:hypothetical protein